jgi:hypothetical protein
MYVLKCLGTHIPYMSTLLSVGRRPGPRLGHPGPRPLMKPLTGGWVYSSSADRRGPVDKSDPTPLLSLLRQQNNNSVVEVPVGQLHSWYS